MKKKNWREARQLAKEHARQPVVGDYWHEMFAPVCVVIDVFMDFVLICKDTIEMEGGKWTWDLSVLTFMHRGDFCKWLHYGTIDECWAEVEPHQQKWAHDYVQGLPREKVFPGWMDEMDRHDA